ncbi:hypothetical protein BDV33DRAFT_210826 [Aspergillus novoparasiticus]|uniref:Uncharacterized protein n=1 Tax=Aspergillus novoparasiticus TaxID=986946 RepID=A0A5N6E7L0_9EURO|nr:hypothetical protein BDV33DRAFT_210826 [Aspergillus novoparasiticus]
MAASRTKPAPRQLLPFQPGKERQVLCQPKKAERRWETKLRAYIDEVPTADRWSEAVTIPSPSPLNVILADNRLTVPATTLNEAFQQKATIIAKLKYYCLWTESIKENDEKFFASFMDFLFCCICHVACCLGISLHDVNSKMERISRGKPAHLMELRSGVAWQLRATGELYKTSTWLEPSTIVGKK